jgi:hypothetical protein
MLPCFAMLGLQQRNRAAKDFKLRPASACFAQTVVYAVWTDVMRAGLGRSFCSLKAALPSIFQRCDSNSYFCR